MRTGIVFGCFIPLHIGHIAMINRSFAENESTIIGVCGYADDRGRDFIPFHIRYELMIKLYHDKANVVKIDDKKLHLDGTFTLENWTRWCNELFSQAHRNPNDSYMWYTGEQKYIDKIEKLYPRHGYTLLDRSIINISGTDIRSNVTNYAQYIEPTFYDYLKKER